MSVSETAIRHGPKPAEQWTEPERYDSLSELSAYDYVPLSPASVEHREIHTSVEKRKVWLWTVEASMAAIVSEWPR